MNRIIYPVIVFNLSACSGAFQPPPPDYAIWTRPNANSLDIKKTLLECGAASPGGAASGFTHNQVALVSICMRQLGYTKKVPPARDDPHICVMHPSLPACQPGAEIPKPSVERRLNSWWCKLHFYYDYCIKHAVVPAACHPDDKKNPPPECLP
jgi:hypothetical protein